MASHARSTYRSAISISTTMGRKTVELRLSLLDGPMKRPLEAKDGVECDMMRVSAMDGVHRVCEVRKYLKSMKGHGPGF